MNVEYIVLALYVLSAGFLLLTILGLKRLFLLSWSWPFVFCKASVYVLISFICLLLAQQLSLFFPIFPQQPIVNVAISKVQERQYRLKLSDTSDNQLVQSESAIDPGADSLLIHGDQWLLEMRILTWHPLLAQLGMQPLYKLERLNGRYQSLVDEKILPRSLYELDKATFSTSYWQMLLPYLHGTLINSYYGAAVYAPMSDSAQYGVFLKTGGVELKALNDEATQALNRW